VPGEKLEIRSRKILSILPSDSSLLKSVPFYYNYKMQLIRVIIALALVTTLLQAMFIPEGGMIRPPHLRLNSPMLAHIQTDKQVYRSLDQVFIELFFSDPVTKKPFINIEHLQITLKVRLMLYIKGESRLWMIKSKIQYMRRKSMKGQ
jgi:hypothetical protein